MKYEQWMNLEWISVEDKPFPVFDRNKADELEHCDFLAAWFYEGHIEGIEWYTYLGDGEFWNQNSNNLNTFDNEHELRGRREPTHWLPVPRGKKNE